MRLSSGLIQLKNERILTWIRDFHSRNPHPDVVGGRYASSCRHSFDTHALCIGPLSGGACVERVEHHLHEARGRRQSVRRDGARG